jgi:hypothetical protein
MNARSVRLKSLEGIVQFLIQSSNKLRNFNNNISSWKVKFLMLSQINISNVLGSVTELGVDDHGG